MRHSIVHHHPVAQMRVALEQTIDQSILESHIDMEFKGLFHPIQITEEELGIAYVPIEDTGIGKAHGALPGYMPLRQVVHAKTLGNDAYLLRRQETLVGRQGRLGGDAEETERLIDTLLDAPKPGGAPVLAAQVEGVAAISHGHKGMSMATHIEREPILAHEGCGEGNDQLRVGLNLKTARYGTRTEKSGPVEQISEQETIQTPGP